jgi:hypothetical protein
MSYALVPPSILGTSTSPHEMFINRILGDTSMVRWESLLVGILGLPGSC